MGSNATTAPSRVRGIWTGSVKIVVSAGLMFFVLRRISLGELADLVTQMDRRVLVAAIACFFFSNILAALQWNRLLTAAGVKLSAWCAFRYYFVGLFFNNFLPANIGGDAVKVYDVARTGGEVYNAIAATVLDRVVGIVALCVLAMVAAAVVVAGGAGFPAVAYLALFVACVFGAVVLYTFRAPGQGVRAVARRVRIFGAGERLTRILDDLSLFRTRRALIGRLLLLSLLIQFLRVATHVLVATALGIAVSRGLFVQFYVFIPILSLAMIPPVTINGLGVREGLGIVLFATAGIGRADAFAIEFLTYGISVAVSLLGWGFFIARRRRRERPVESV